MSQINLITVTAFEIDGDPWDYSHIFRFADGKVLEISYVVSLTYWDVSASLIDDRGETLIQLPWAERADCKLGVYPEQFGKYASYLEAAAACDRNKL